MYSICSLACILTKVRKRIDGRAFLQFSFCRSMKAWPTASGRPIMFDPHRPGLSADAGERTHQHGCRRAALFGSSYQQVIAD